MTEDPNRVRVRRNGVFVTLPLRPVLTGSQVRVARGLLGWTQATLAGKAKVSLTVVADIEADRTVPAAPLRTLRDALRLAGIEFSDEGAPRQRA